MIHPLILQATDTESLKLTGEIGICVLFIGKLVDIWNNYREGVERKKHTIEFTEQTVLLRGVNTTLTSIKDSQAKDTQTIALGSQRQGDIKVTVDRIDRNVRDLKMIAGIPDTETTQLYKKDVKNPE